MEAAIKKSIEGGYIVDIGWKEETRQGYCERNRLLLDPLFWQALGKSLGWEDVAYRFENPNDLINSIDIPHWKLNWHRFIDHLADGKSVDEFFNNLIT